MGRGRVDPPGGRARSAAIGGAVTRIVIALLIFVVSALYRFNTLGGAFGGFDDDQFLFITRGWQMLRGDLPVRDFPEPGGPLAWTASALAIRAFGYHLGAEAIMTVVAFAATSALVFLLARAITVSTGAGLAAALLATAIAPRFYNYPKVLLYAIGLALMWRYVGRPSRGGLFGLALLVAVAALFRHDHGIYLGVLGALAVGIAHAPRWREAGAAIAAFAIVAALLLVPYFAFVQWHQGIVPYFRSAAAWAGRDLSRTALRAPRFEMRAEPWYAVDPPEALPVPHVKVQWHPMPHADRAALETRYGLEPREQLSESEWDYRIHDASPQNLEAIVRDPAARDTDGIDRTTFRLSSDPPQLSWWASTRRELPVLRTRLAPGVLHAENALPFLFYFAWVVPVLAAMVLWAKSGDLARVMPGVARPAAKVVLLIAMAALLDRAFLRGNLEARIADVSVPIAVLAAWLGVAVLRSRRPGPYALRAGVVAAVALAAAASVAVNASVRTEIVGAGLTAGPSAMLARTEEIWQGLSQDPPAVAAAYSRDTAPFALAAYLAACTRPDDRVLAVGYMPALFFYANRAFAGGLVAVMPNWFPSSELRDDPETSRREQRDAIARLRSQRVPIAVVDDAEYDTRYRQDFPLLTMYLDEQYREVGAIESRGQRFRVAAHRDLRAASTYEPLDLPCF